MEVFEQLRRQAYRWAQDHLDELRHCDPAIPSELDDRAADNWRLLLAIADLVGGAWPEAARRAARLLSGADDATTEAPATLLLADLRARFTDLNIDRLLTVDILEHLHSLDDRPWAEWRQGRPLSPAQLAKLLKPYGVSSRTVRSEKRLKGYRLEQFDDAFARYLPALEPCRRDNPAPEPVCGELARVTVEGVSRTDMARQDASDLTCHAGTDGREEEDPDEAARREMEDGA
jgi:hypothetical protein